MRRLQPWIRLADHLGSRRADGRRACQNFSVRYYGALAESHAVNPAASAAAGVPRLCCRTWIFHREPGHRAFSRHRCRGSRSACRHLAGLIGLLSPAMATMGGRDHSSRISRLVAVRSVMSGAAGTLLVIANDDQPGVIGEVGTILGRHGIGIAALRWGAAERSDRRRERGRGRARPKRWKRRRNNPARAARPRRVDYSAKRPRITPGWTRTRRLVRATPARVHVKDHPALAFNRRARDAANRTAFRAIDRALKQARQLRDGAEPDRSSSTTDPARHRHPRAGRSARLRIPVSWRQ